MGVKSHFSASLYNKPSRYNYQHRSDQIQQITWQNSSLFASCCVLFFTTANYATFCVFIYLFRRAHCVCVCMRVPTCWHVQLGGIVTPNDGRCHLDNHGMYTESLNQVFKVFLSTATVFFWRWRADVKAAVHLRWGSVDGWRRNEFGRWFSPVGVGASTVFSALTLDWLIGRIGCPADKILHYLSPNVLSEAGRYKNTGGSCLTGLTIVCWLDLDFWGYFGCCLKCFDAIGWEPGRASGL